VTRVRGANERFADELDDPREVPRLSVVVPCYNEEESLVNLCQRVTTVCRSIVGDSFEIILINDGSRDRTWPLIVEQSDVYPEICGINLSRNFGHQSALSAGLDLSRGDLVLILDADLQDPPELLSAMIEKIDGGADVVYGERSIRHGESVGKKLTARLFYRIIRRLSDVEIPANVGDFRLMTRQVVDELTALPENQRFVRGMVPWLGFTQVALPYERAPRAEGTTHYNMARMLRLAADGITAFSVQPLRYCLWTGFFAAFGCIGLLLYILISVLFFQATPGWASIATIVLFFSALQLIFLGIIGEYVGRVFNQVKGRPIYVVRDVHRTQRTKDGQPQRRVGDRRHTTLVDERTLADRRTGHR
jgi:polyisoprenyl-phosphate glycosyltransferase